MNHGRGRRSAHLGRIRLGSARSGAALACFLLGLSVLQAQAGANAGGTPPAAPSLAFDPSPCDTLLSLEYGPGPAQLDRAHLFSGTSTVPATIRVRADGIWLFSNYPEASLRRFQSKDGEAVLVESLYPPAGFSEFALKEDAVYLCTVTRGDPRCIRWVPGGSIATVFFPREDFYGHQARGEAVTIPGPEHLTVLESGIFYVPVANLTPHSRSYALGPGELKLRLSDADAFDGFPTDGGHYVSQDSSGIRSGSTRLLELPRGAVATLVEVFGDGSFVLELEAGETPDRSEVVRHFKFFDPAGRRTAEIMVPSYDRRPSGRKPSGQVRFDPGGVYTTWLDVDRFRVLKYRAAG